MRKALKAIGIAIILFGICLCGHISWSGEKELTGAGATFPEPFYYKVFDVYQRQFGVRVNYRGVGSGAGMRELINKRVEFAGSDIVPGGPMPDEAEGALVHIPTCVGAVAMIYNLPDNPTLRFTPEVLADIFLGKISRWNDPRLLSINREVRLPDLTISVVHRSDESGTTYIFTDYLGKTSAEWRKTMGGGKPHLGWPVGQGARGNPALAGMVKQISGSIGYVELTYAVANVMTFGSVRNSSGKFIIPHAETVSSAAKAGGKSDPCFSLTDTPAADGYPISGFTWLAVFREQNYGGRDRETADGLVKMLYWITHEGQKYAPPLRYVPLPREVVKKAESVLRTVTYNGVPLMKKPRR